MPPKHLIARLVSTEPRTLTVSVREASRITGLGQTTVKKLIHDRVIESRKVGTRRVILMKSLQRFVDER